MRTWKDNTGQSWNLSVTVGSIKRVRDLCEVDLTKASDGQLLQELAQDPILLCDVLYALCKPQADERDVPDEQFGELLGGESLDQASVALLEDLVAFFPPARRRMLQTAVEKMRAAENLVADLAIERLESPELEARVREAMSSGLAMSSLPSPEPPPSQEPSGS